MSTPPPPRVLIFPFPAEGHINPMLKLAELLALSGVHITFLNTEHVHRRHDYSGRYAGIRFRTIPDGLVEDHPRSPDRVLEVLYSMNASGKTLLKQFLVSSDDYRSPNPNPNPNPPGVTCIIADGVFDGFTIEVGDELQIPVILFRTFSACCFWTYFSIPDIIEAGELPIRGEDDMDRIIKTVAGMESFLRCRDLPSCCRAGDTTDSLLHLMAKVTRQSKRAHALILNTFEDLEGPILSHIRARCNRKTYAIGPLHARLQKKPDGDRNCMAWLDSQPPNSVIFVCFGSLAVLRRDQLMEFWHGLVNSKRRFLLAMRKDLLAEGDQGRVPRELLEGTEERGFVAGWVPQAEVLSHRAVGGFLTHCGWNSTLESVVAGVPMICWPSFVDQPINSRFVGEVWKLGIDMKDVCDRNVVEKMVNDMMVKRRDEFARSTAEMARLAKKSVTPGGSSYCDLEGLISEIVRLKYL